MEGVNGNFAIKWKRKRAKVVATPSALFIFVSLDVNSRTKSQNGRCYPFQIGRTRGESSGARDRATGNTEHFWRRTCTSTALQLAGESPEIEEEGDSRPFR